MNKTARKTAQLGELVVTAFDQAARYSEDPEAVSRLATRAVMHILRNGRRPNRVASRRVKGTS